ncbi:ATP-binding protein [Nonomuraea rhizosphaerae]|uniref:ATP-binding protein n=1 Tax=Nonomuraea rhizosphaerae TaxID=2665663 RepID=UPI001C5EF6D8|nr:ATP-binding protein [Nonomuraea rhizosphaerae]
MYKQVLSATFARGCITALRRSVSEHAAGEGLAGRRLEDFVLAVNEITTNAVLHGGGSGRLRLWWQEDLFWCEVTDDGPGLPLGWISASRAPSGYEPRGRGLWLTRLLCLHVTVVSGPGGTSVRFAATAD